MKKVFYLLSTSFILFGCPGVIDTLSRKELSGGYIFEAMDFPYIYRDMPTHKYIPAMVKSYAYDSKFIIATQKSSKICNEQLPKDYTYDDCNALVERLVVEPNYWIISLKQDSIYGPLSFKEYLSYREKLGVSKDLKLKD